MSAGSCNTLAWLPAAAKDPGHRDCKKAIDPAQKALKLGKNGAWLDTLAAAHAECGEFNEAVILEEQARAASNPPNENFRKLLQLYRNRISYADYLETGEGA